MTRKILLISPQPFFQWRGSPIRLKFNLLALSEAGYSIDFLTLPIGEDLPIANVSVYRVGNPFKVRDIPIGPSGWKIFFDILIFFKALSLCIKNRYVVIHGIEEAGFISCILAGIFRTKCIFEKHSDPESHKSGVVKNCILWLYQHIEKTAVRMADAVICTGPGLVKQVDSMGTATPAYNIPDIPSSLQEPSTEEVALMNNQLVKNDGEIVVTFVGSFAVYQGIDLLFAALPEVVRADIRARFVLIGGTSCQIEERKSTLSKLGVAKNVTFLGKIAPDTLPAYLAASDILLSPRISGVNTPLKVLDYLKAGRAIVASDRPSNRLLLDDDTAVFASATPPTYAEAIVSLLQNEDKRNILGRNCRRLYEKSYTFENHRLRLQKCYDSLGGNECA